MRNRDFDKKRTEVQVAADIREKLAWLLPMAESTLSLSQHPGMIGECLLTGSPGENDHVKVLKIQTLYHADRLKTEGYIKDMIMDLDIHIKARELRMGELLGSSTLDQSASQVVATGSASTCTGRPAIEFDRMID
ncbi:protein PSK SIMULATOR 1-like [Oryza brachyantha]|uniref:protein PSK SIMULATOR 1-like n=1 Tax=Oryza brachyantha TaxID=4533 RepID=UPI001ADBF333|nr:protein PSK SIMULATOR 1-like [Oryza brachyantha]